MNFNIYVPSYNRYDAILTKNLLEYCTYVVRKSEEDAYRAAGVNSIISVEDSLICSAEKVHNWLIENAEEEVIAVLDDDIEYVNYRLDEIERIDDPVQLTSELERLGQIVYDLGIGYMASPNDNALMYYDRPFKFVGVTGSMKIYNRTKLRARLQEDLHCLSDMELELEELLHNRIILIPVFLTASGRVDTNAGGNNNTKTKSMFDAEDEILKLKWGQYYEKASEKSRGGIRVKR